jgi:hypothetical protein
MNMKDIETDAVSLDGSKNIGADGIDEINSEGMKAKKKLEAARDKGAGERSQRGGGGLMGKASEFLGNDTERDRGRDR